MLLPARAALAAYDPDLSAVWERSDITHSRSGTTATSRPSGSSNDVGDASSPAGPTAHTNGATCCRDTWDVCRQSPLVRQAGKPLLFKPSCIGPPRASCSKRLLSEPHALDLGAALRPVR